MVRLALLNFSLSPRDVIHIRPPHIKKARAKRTAKIRKIVIPQPIMRLPFPDKPSVGIPGGALISTDVPFGPGTFRERRLLFIVKWSHSYMAEE